MPVRLLLHAAQREKKAYQVSSVYGTSAGKIPKPTPAQATVILVEFVKKLIDLAEAYPRKNPWGPNLQALLCEVSLDPKP